MVMVVFPYYVSFKASLPVVKPLGMAVRVRDPHGLVAGPAGAMIFALCFTLDGHHQAVMYAHYNKYLHHQLYCAME